MHMESNHLQKQALAFEQKSTATIRKNIVQDYDVEMEADPDNESDEEILPQRYSSYDFLMIL